MGAGAIQDVQSPEPDLVQDGITEPLTLEDIPGEPIELSIENPTEPPLPQVAPLEPEDIPDAFLDEPIQNPIIISTLPQTSGNDPQMEAVTGQAILPDIQPSLSGHSSVFSTVLKASVTASMFLSTPNHSPRSHPLASSSQTTASSKKPTLQPEPQSTPELTKNSALEFTITPGTTIYSLSKKHNLGNDAWFQYRQHWRIKNADGSLTMPLDVRLPIGAKLIYSTTDFPIQKQISKTIEPNYTIWQFCQDNALSAKYWRHPENFFRVQFPGKTEFRTPDIYHLPINGTLHFDKDGFRERATKENPEPQIDPRIEKRVIPEIPEMIITENQIETREYLDRLNTPI